MQSDDETGKPEDGGERPLRLATPVKPLRLGEEPGAREAAPGALPPTPAPERWTGDALRRAREGRGLTVRQLADRTKVTPIHIANVEADRYDQLPPVVYLRGILLTLARELRLDGQKVSRSYLDAMREATGR